jgi:tRNA (guanine26-N2/guanine27-N2)-dimethyltransferase
MSNQTTTESSNSVEMSTDDQTLKSSLSPTVDEALYNKVREGKALVYFNKTKNEVFYNPIQEFNRDLSIAVLNTHSATSENKKLRILEALAASGIRSMRYALEVANCQEVVANDFDRKAVELININRELNGVADRVTASCDDATLLMSAASRHKNTQFDAIDLDPYGTPAAFLDSAIRSVRSGGLLLVTATDAGVLCGNGSDTCFTKYGSVSLRTPACHELALRILLQALNSHAVRYSKFIVPVLSLSIDFYFRLFVRVYDGQLQAKESINNIGFFHICCECHSFYKQSYGHTVPTTGNVKFVHASRQPFGMNKCDNCGGGLKMVGPVWTGKLHDKKFIQETINHVDSKTAETLI